MSFMRTSARCGESRNSASCDDARRAATRFHALVGDKSERWVKVIDHVAIAVSMNDRISDEKDRLRFPIFAGAG